MFYLKERTIIGTQKTMLKKIKDNFRQFYGTDEKYTKSERKNIQSTRGVDKSLKSDTKKENNNLRKIFLQETQNYLKFSFVFEKQLI